MRIPDLYADGRFALSFEVFPPKTSQGMESLLQAVEKLCAFRPGFVSCTYGAGGSTREQTLDIVTNVRERFGVPTTAHFTCVGSTVAEIRAWLAEAQSRNVENIMALRGDPPKGETTFQAVEGGFCHANELVGFIRSEFPQFGIGVAGYPETHQEAVDADADLRYLLQKVTAGADAVFTQLFYDNADFLRFRDRCHAIGVRRPIIPGLLPILRLDQVQRITSLCKAKLPADLAGQLTAHADNPDAQTAVGIEHATRQVEGLLREGVPGIHFYVLNRSEPTCRILDNVAGRLPTA